MQTPIIRAQPLYQAVRERIRELVLSGELQAGHRITEVDLSQGLGVSRTPVREALKQLMIEGLVQREPNGYSVFRPTAADVADIYLCRAAIESQAVAMLSLEVNEGVLQDIEAIVLESEGALGQGDMAVYLQLNTRFHEILVTASGNKALIATYEAVGLRTVLCRSLTLQNAAAREDSTSDHRRILELIKRRQPTEEVVRAHIYKSALRAIRILNAKAEFVTPSMRYLLNWSD